MLPPVVLGPQRPNPNAPDALRAHAPTGGGPLVVLTAGWRGDETDDEAVRRHLGATGTQGAAVLPLYTWFEVVMRELPELRAQYRARQDALAELRRLHRLRLHPALAVVAQFLEALATPGATLVRDKGLAEEHLALALADVRRIDAQLVDAIAAILARHATASAPWETHPVVERLRARAATVLGDARGVAIAGGHVAVLLNRIQFFGVDAILAKMPAEGRPIVAWSAGAMVLADHIVLFYDDPPDGSGEPELLDRGLGLVPGAVFLPHARQRLRLDDRGRVASLARRFPAAPCLGLENGAWLVRTPTGWANRGAAGTAFALGRDGTVGDLDGVAPDGGAA